MKFFAAASLAVIALFQTDQLYAKNKDLIKGNYYYKHNQYHTAIPFLERVVDEQNDPVVYGQLGECYLKTSRADLASKWLGKAAGLEGCPDEIVMEYCQVLMGLQKYDSAKKLLTAYQTRHSGEGRVAGLLASCESAPAKLMAKPKGEVSFLNLNTNGSEYAPTVWKNKLVFTADVVVDEDSKKNKIKEFTYNSVYFVPCDKYGLTGKDFKKISVTGVAEKENMAHASFSADGKRMYFTTTQAGDMKKGIQPNRHVIADVPMEIMIASDFDSSSNTFTAYKPFKYNSKEHSVSHPTVSPDGEVLMFCSNMEGGEGGSDIYICKRGEDGEWTEPVNAGKMINTEGEEVYPYLADNNTLFFSSDGHEGLGGLDIFMAKYNPGSNTFSKPVNVGTPINSSYDDISLAVYADLRSCYFSSNRPSYKGGDNIFFYSKNHAYVKIKLFDDVTNDPLNVANISMESPTEKTYVSVNKLGEFVAPVYTDAQYKMTVGKNGYAPYTVNINAASFKDNDTIVQTVMLSSLNIPKPSKEDKPTAPLVKNEPPVTVRDSNYYKKPSLFLLSIVDSMTKKPIKKASVTLESDKDDREITANEKGQVFTQLIPEIPYKVSVSKKGYQSNAITIKTIFAHDEPDTFTERVALIADKFVKVKKHKHAGEQTTDADEQDAVAAGKTHKGKRGGRNRRNKDAADNTADVLQKGRLVSLDGYYAEYNKYDIVDSKKYILDSLVTQLKENPTMRIRIFGHADCRGGADYNMKLSVQRAIAVGKYLVSQGIDPRRLEHKGLGSAKPVEKCPVCNECSEQQHERNRGFEYTVLHK